MPERIAIIGAGIAGLSAAEGLHRAGHHVTVFDKSRGVGGRVATRRTEALHFDHGAAYLTAETAPFAAQLERWRAQGHVAAWFDGRMVGTPGMTAPARAMTEGLTLALDRTVTGLAPSGAGWTVTIGADTAGPFDAVLLAVPAPHARPVLATAGVSFPEVERAVYAPCWALLLALDGSAEGRPPWREPGDGVVAALAENGTKPGRAAAPRCLVAHATAAWSRAHLEDSAESVRDALLAHLAPGLDGAAPSSAAAHRWRFAFVETAAGVPFAWDPARRIGACGDWCLGPRVEDAFTSGRALGETVSAALSR